ncbi:MAG: DUF1376 domain-containing protein [Gammaproteobacteria bacterium]|nr:DUF1376 domain-containing protein [Gammaproteobacteria bacterium]
MAARGCIPSGAETRNGKVKSVDASNSPARDAAGQTLPRRDPRNGQIKYTRLWISDLLADTYRLTPAALGVYMRLYCASISAQAPLRDDPRVILPIAGASRGTWNKLRVELLAAGVLEVVGGLLHDRRAEKAIKEFQAASRRNRGNVARRYAACDGLRDVEP